MQPAGPLRSTRVTALHHYYEPRRLLVTAPRLMSSSSALGSTPETRSPRFLTTLSSRAAPNHPGRFDDCTYPLLRRRSQASSPLEAWPPALSARPEVRGASRGRIGFAFAAAHDFASEGSIERIAPGDASSATCVNGQFTWLAPFIQQEGPGFAWRTKGRKGRRAQRFGPSFDRARRWCAWGSSKIQRVRSGRGTRPGPTLSLATSS
jgi:hypothetical protein